MALDLTALEERRAKDRARYRLHRTEVLAKRAAHRKAHPAKFRERDCRYYEANRAAVLQKRHASWVKGEAARTEDAAGRRRLRDSLRTLRTRVAAVERSAAVLFRRLGASERRRESGRKRYLEKREELLSYGQTYYREHAEARRRYQAAYRQRKLAERLASAESVP